MKTLNDSLNVLCALFILVGAALTLKNPHTGELMITSGFSAFGGAAVAKAAALLSAQAAPAPPPGPTVPN